MPISNADPSPESIPHRVAVYDKDGDRLIDVVISVTCESDTAAVRPGWAVTDQGILFDGRPVSVAPSRVRLLRALVEAEGRRLRAADLIGTAFDACASETNVRYHVAELRKELEAAFPGFEGNTISADGGYALAIR